VSAVLSLSPLPEGVMPRSHVIFAGWFYTAGGVALSVFGPGLEAIREEFELEYAGVGAALAVLGVGYIAGSLVGGSVVGRVGARLSIIAGVVVAAVGMTLAGVSPTLTAFLGGLGLASVGWGAGEVAIATIIAGGGGRTAVRDLNLAQIGFAVGAIAAPIIVGGSFLCGWGWRPPVLLGGALASTVAIIAYALALETHPYDRGPIQVLAKGTLTPIFVLIGVAAALSVAHEVGFSGFFAPYLEHQFDLDRALAAGFVTVFWAGSCAGRCVGAWLSGRLDLPALLVGSAIGSVGASLLVALASPLWVSLFGLALVGVASGTLLPSLLVLAVRHNPSNAGMAVGGVIAIAGVGGIGGSLGVGWAADAWTLKGAMLVMPAVMVAALAVLQVVRLLAAGKVASSVK